MADKRRQQSGFTLVEVLVAFAMLALVSGALLGVFNAASRVSNRGENINRATMLANNAVEAAKTSPAAIDVAGKVDYYNRDLQPVTLENALYRVTTQVTTGEAVNMTGIALDTQYVKEMGYNHFNHKEFKLVVEDVPSSSAVKVTFDGVELPNLQPNWKQDRVVTVAIHLMQDKNMDTYTSMPMTTLKASNLTSGTNQRTLKVYFLTDIYESSDYTTTNEFGYKLSMLAQDGKVVFSNLLTEVDLGQGQTQEYEITVNVDRVKEDAATPGIFQFDQLTAVTAKSYVN